MYKGGKFSPLWPLHPLHSTPSLTSNRKTGVSIPTQEFDAFGFENPDGFFSPSPAPEKTSQPLDAFLAGAQGGSHAAAALGSPAPAVGGMGGVAMSGSGEESMDIDSGVDGEFTCSLGGGFWVFLGGDGLWPGEWSRCLLERTGRGALDEAT